MKSGTLRQDARHAQNQIGIYPLDFLVCAAITCLFRFKEQIPQPR